MTALRGDADLARIAGVIADPARARMLLALSDGRALAASLLASEAGVAPSTASEHLGRLLEAGLVTVDPQGRHRYFRLAGAEVAGLIESLARLAPTFEVRTLRQGTRARALREARTCYDHLAGRLGVALFRSLLERGWIAGGDGLHRLDGAVGDRLSAPGRDVSYGLAAAGRRALADLGVRLPVPARDGTVPLRYCVDWTEQRHHLSGAVGRALAERLFELGWLARAPKGRAVAVTPAGRDSLADAFGAGVLG